MASWGKFYTQGVESIGIEPGKQFCHGQAKPKCDSPVALIELYTKISFGVIAVGFLLVSLVVSSYHRAVALRALGLIVLAAAAAEATFHFHVAYAQDIVEFVSEAAGGSLDTQRFLSLVIGNAPILVASLAALLVVRVAGRREPLDALFVLGCIVASMEMRSSIGDNNTGLLVSLVAVPLCMGELARRVEAKREPTTGWRGHFGSLGCLMLALLFMGFSSPTCKK